MSWVLLGLLVFTNLVFCVFVMRIYRECAEWRQMFADQVDTFGLLLDEMAKTHPELASFAKSYHSKFDGLMERKS